MRRTLQVGLRVLELLGAEEHSAWSPGKEGAAGCDPLLMSLRQPRLCSSCAPASGQSSPVASWRLPPTPQPQAAKVGSLSATLHNYAPLLLSLFLPDTQLLLFIWITFLCYAISVVFPSPPSTPLPFPVAEFLRRGDFEETVSTSALSLQHSRRALSGVQVPGSRTRWAVEAGGQSAGPWPLRPWWAHSLQQAGLSLRARGCCQSPGAAAHQLPGPAGCGCWLSAQTCACQAWGERNKEPSKTAWPSFSSYFVRGSERVGDSVGVHSCVLERVCWLHEGSEVTGLGFNF